MNAKVTGDFERTLTLCQRPNVMVIDADTGTVLGGNLYLVYANEQVQDRILDSDFEAKVHAENFGIPLYANLDDAE